MKEFSTMPMSAGASGPVPVFIGTWLRKVQGNGQTRRLIHRRGLRVATVHRRGLRVATERQVCYRTTTYGLAREGS